MKSIKNITFNENNFIEDLLNYSLKNNLLTQNELKNILYKFYKLLIIQMQKSVGKHTSCLTINEAKNINNSNLWVIGLYIQNFDLNECLTILKNSDIYDLYLKSQKNIVKIIDKVKLFYNINVLNNILDINNKFYIGTLIYGIKGFFKIYNYVYDAENLCINYDYEPFLKLPISKGISYLKLYLEYINAENIFCKNFKIKNMLEIVFKNYESIHINIFEYTFIFSLILELQNKDIKALNVLKIDLEKLYSMDLNIISKNLNKSYKNLCKKIYLTSYAKDYLDKSFPFIKRKIIFLIKNKSFDYLLFNKTNKIIYICTLPCKDGVLDKMLYDLNKLSDNEKLNYINKNVSSLIDYVNIMDNLYLSKKETYLLFDNLKISELMALKKFLIINNNDRVNELNEYICQKSENVKNIINKYYDDIEIIYEN